MNFITNKLLTSKRLKLVMFLICLICSMYIYVQQSQENDLQQNQNSIEFIADEANNIKGIYTPSLQKTTPQEDDQSNNASSAMINDQTYINIIESKFLLPEQNLQYLGYFTQKIYLYGEQTPSGQTEEENSGNENTDTENEQNNEDSE